MTPEESASILKRINAGIPWITIQDTYGCTRDELTQIAGFKPMKSNKEIVSEEQLKRH